MAVNWAHPLTRWQQIVRSWVEHPDPQPLIEAAVFLDFRAAHGSLPVHPLREELLAARNAPRFLTALARTASSFAPPLGVLGRIRTDERFVDLKRGGLAAIVILARIYAMEAGIESRSTLDRLAAARAQGVISEHGAAGLSDAFRFLMHLRLREQLEQVAAGREPENRIRYDRLTWLEQRRLRDAFRTVAEMQKATTVRLHAV
jgi:CBS domain-containing protein